MTGLRDMPLERFERLVEEALDTIPAELADIIQNVEFVIEDAPAAGLLRHMGVPEGGTLLGLYQGVPVTRRGFYYGNVLPDRVVLYRLPILGQCKREDDVPGLVREVVIHEVGHYFGLDDRQLARLEGRI